MLQLTRLQPSLQVLDSAAAEIITLGKHVEGRVVASVRRGVSYKQARKKKTKNYTLTLKIKLPAAGAGRCMCACEWPEQAWLSVGKS